MTLRSLGERRFANCFACIGQKQVWRKNMCSIYSGVWNGDLEDNDTAFEEIDDTLMTMFEKCLSGIVGTFVAAYRLLFF
jgi:hypothetical protein